MTESHMHVPCPLVQPIRLPKSLTKKHGDEGHIYVLRYSSNVIKVGTTRCPEQRLQTHLARARVFGATVTAAWLSFPHLNATGNEARLIRWCHSQAGVIALSKEEFDNLGFDAAVAAAEDWPYDRAVPLDLPNIPRFYTLPEVAAQTGLSLRSLKEGCRLRRFEHMRLGRGRYMIAKQIAQLPAAPAAGMAVDPLGGLVPGVVAPVSAPGTT